MVRADAFSGLLTAMGFRVVDVTPLSPAEQRSRAAMALLSDDDLRALWDNPDMLDGHETLCCDDVHAELNRRGRGEWCAI